MTLRINLALLTVAALVNVSAHAADFKLSSQTIKNNKPLDSLQVFNSFGCNGGNTSPDLHWSGEPAGTKSFAITIYDPSAPSISGWWHWTMVNIPASVHNLEIDAGNANGKNVPAGAVQGRNDYGYAGFGGACPPPGFKSHPYIFTVWALDTDKLPITEESSGALVGYQLKAHMIAKAELKPVYGKK
jgi:hypothetical protein